MLLKDNSQNVVSDVIDGEAVLLHLKAGNYFCLGGCAKALWAALLEGAEAEHLLAALARAYPQESRVGLESDLMNWLEQLRREDLIVECPQGAAPSSARSDPDFEAPYQTPELHKYSDLQDLLLIDPIHESDAAGWPALPG